MRSRKPFDASLLEPGLGPATYLKTDGSIIWDDDYWGVQGNLADADAAIQTGIINTTGRKFSVKSAPDSDGKPSPLSLRKLS